MYLLEYLLNNLLLPLIPGHPSGTKFLINPGQLNLIQKTSHITLLQHLLDKLLTGPRSWITFFMLLELEDCFVLLCGRFFWMTVLGASGTRARAWLGGLSTLGGWLFSEVVDEFLDVCWFLFGC